MGLIHSLAGAFIICHIDRDYEDLKAGEKIVRCPSAMADEEERLKALGAYDLEGKGGLPSLDPVVEIATRLFDMPVAAVNLIGSDHVFFAASHGIGDTDMRREVSFCAHVITQDDVLVVPDTLQDPRFFDNPLATGDDPVRFYAGVPIRAPSGHALGALCVIDTKAHRVFTPGDRMRLKELARVATERLELRRLEVAESSGRAPFEKSAATSPNAIICFDRDLNITAWNAAAEVMLGYRAGEVIGHSIDMLIPDEGQAPIREMVRGVLAGRAATSGADCREYTGIRKDGTRVPVEFAWSSWTDDGDRYFGAIVRDVTERRAQEEVLNRLANFDTLTGLANRNLIYRRADEAIRAGKAAAMAIIDLDGFNDVNNTLGHEAGDALLQEVASRLGDRAGPQDVVARIGGDEFAMLLVGIEDRESVQEVVEGAIADLGVPIRVAGQDVRIGCSAGIAMSPLHAVDVRGLAGSADLALFQAKSEGGGRAFVFIPSLRMAAAARRDSDAALHQAVEQDEFVLHYQPQFRLSDGALTGAEALLRWQHPKLGLLYPADFLSALEAGSLGAAAGTRLLDAACCQAALWRSQGVEDFRIAVNLFAAQFRDGDLVDTVRATLARHTLPPEALELEITENIVLDREDKTLPPLRILREMGVRLAFDDYGTGYASLSLLKTYPLTHIKIDKSFVQGMVDSGSDRAIVAAIMDLARGFALDVIAEGVETETQRELLRVAGCDEIQGFLMGRPIPADAFGETFISRYAGNAAGAFRP